MLKPFGTPLPRFAKERILTPDECAEWAVSDETMRQIDELERARRNSAAAAHITPLFVD